MVEGEDDDRLIEAMSPSLSLFVDEIKVNPFLQFSEKITRLYEEEDAEKGGLGDDSD